MKKRLLCLLLCLAMLLCLLPTAALAANNDTVWIGNVKLSKGQYLASGSTTATTVKPDTGYAYWKAGEDNVLVLDNYTYDGEGHEYAYYPYGDGSVDYGNAAIYCAASYTVTLQGSNNIRNTSEGGDGFCAFSADITFNGTGSLKVDADFCIVAYQENNGSPLGNCTINGVNMELYGSGNCLYITNSLNVRNSTLYLDSSTPVFCDTNSSFINSKITVDAWDCGIGIWGYNNLTFQNSIVDITAHDDAMGITANGDVTFTSSKVIVETNGGAALTCKKNGLQIKNGQKVITPENYKFHCYYSEDYEVDLCCITDASGVCSTVFFMDTFFVDVPAGSYYEEAVDWAVDKGITTGATYSTFDPNGSCTRAQAVTFLWRTAGEPEPTIASCPFTDVLPNSYYYKAVLWAVEKGITKGISETAFAPDNACNRAHAVTFLWRLMGEEKVGDIANPFVDVAADTWYTDSVLWAVENEITTGTSETTFEPTTTCNRAHIVTFLYRCLVKS